MLRFCITEYWGRFWIEIQILTLGNGRELSSPNVQRTLFARFSSFVWAIAALQHSTVKLQIISEASFLIQVDKAPNKLLNVRF